MSHSHGPPAGSLAATVADQTGSSPLKCYQCGRCAAGCMQNLPGEMDVSPTRVMRLVQLEAAFAEDREQAASYAARALGSDTPWLCAGCLACTTRCPQDVDIAGTMDVLRQESIRRGMASQSRRARDIQALHRTFLGGVLRGGRLHELLLVIGYKLRTWHFFQDAQLGPAMMKRGKLHCLPKKGPSTERIRAAIARLRACEKKNNPASHHGDSGNGHA